jgi:hypothetical protein
METYYTTEKEWQYTYEEWCESEKEKEQDNSRIKRWNYYDDILNDMMDLIWEYEEDGLVNAEDIKTEIRDYFNNLKTK